MDDDHLRGYDDGSWTPEPDLILWHGTSTKLAADIERTGIRLGSCWGTERVARYFAEGTCSERGGRHLMLGVRLDALDVSRMRIDPVMIEFPIFPDYDKRQYEWEERSSQEWQECLRLYEAVTYRAVVPWSLLVRS